jgi:hypothetical protein
LPGSFCQQSWVSPHCNFSPAITIGNSAKSTSYQIGLLFSYTLLFCS